jgi:hypothetical protein
MKKFLTVIMFTLALNFLAVGGAVGYLVKTGHLDREKLLAVREVIFPKPPEAAPATQPSAAAARPTLQLDELLAKYSGHSGGEQVEFIQQAFDGKMAQLDRKQSELAALQETVDKAAAKLARDRAQLGSERQTLSDREQQANRLASDKGFQDSLMLYQSMPSKQAKTLFMTLDDQTVVDYLQAMPPSKAAKITKEFTKAPEEQLKIKRVMEMMRLSQETKSPTTKPSSAPGAQQASAQISPPG